MPDETVKDQKMEILSPAGAGARKAIVLSALRLRSGRQDIRDRAYYNYVLLHEPQVKLPPPREPEMPANSFKHGFYLGAVLSGLAVFGSLALKIAEVVVNYPRAVEAAHTMAERQAMPTATALEDKKWVEYIDNPPRAIPVIQRPAPGPTPIAATTTYHSANISRRRSEQLAQPVTAHTVSKN